MILKSTGLFPEISFSDIDRNSILKAMSIPAASADQYLMDLLDSLIVQCMEMCSPAANYMVFHNPEFDKRQGTMRINGFEFNVGQLVLSFFRKSSHMAVFVSTCGSQVEEFSKSQIDQGHFLEGLIINIIGSAIADQTARHTLKEIENEASTYGLKITNRYSPGYCDWPVSDQQKLFALMEGNHCGIKLTESSLMIPIKSVSGMIGIGKDVKMMDYCRYCPKVECTFRNN